MSVDTNLIKKPYSKEKFTPQQLQELAMSAVDPQYFITNFLSSET